MNKKSWLSKKFNTATMNYERATTFYFMLAGPATTAQLEAAKKYGTDVIREMKEKKYLYAIPSDRFAEKAEDIARCLFEALGGFFEGDIVYIQGVRPDVLGFLKKLARENKSRIIEQL